jgi:hypothetical protein
MATTLAFNGETGFLLEKTGTGTTINLISGINALRQKMQERLRFFFGEWALDTSAGVPYFESIFPSPINPSLIISIIDDELLKEPEINRIKGVSFEYDEKNRKMNYSFTAETIYGNIDFSTV